MYNKEYNEEIIQHFNLYHFIYGMEGSSLLRVVSKDDFLAFYEVIESIINYNYLNNVFDIDVKRELYNCLSLYRENINNKCFLEKINELVAILNMSNDKNLDEFLRNQFICHFNNIFTFKEKVTILENIRYFKQSIYNAIANDVYVVSDLIDEHVSTLEFIKTFVGKKNPMFTINYLLNCYPELFKQDGVKEKIQGLLLENRLVIKGNSQVNNISKSDFKSDESRIMLFGKTSKKMMKKIKKI